MRPAGFASGYVVSLLGAEGGEDRPESPLKIGRRLSSVHWAPLRGYEEKPEVKGD